jgi:tetratricopeptide (TPR) repeat protein
MTALLRQAAAQSQGLLVCTSRLPLSDLQDFEGHGSQFIDLEDLSAEFGAEYLVKLGVRGQITELKAASEEFGNHALALTLLGRYLVKRREGDVRRRDSIPHLFAEAKYGGHARRVLRGYEDLFENQPELAVLRMVGLFDRPIDVADLCVLQAAPAIPRLTDVLQNLSNDEWATALERLSEARLIHFEDPNGSLDCHQLVREHFRIELETKDRRTFQNAQERLYEHYRASATYRPSTMEGMIPLYRAIYHGCRAGKIQEVCSEIYEDRVLRHGDYFINRWFGAFGTSLSLMANFFETPWSQPSSSLREETQSWLLSEAGYLLRSLGRLREAVEPTKRCMELAYRFEQWSKCANQCGRLSKLYLMLGRLSEAVETAGRAVAVADRSGLVVERVTQRIVLLDVFHQTGRLYEAMSLFEEADAIAHSVRMETTNPYVLKGYPYRDLLLSLGRFKDVAVEADTTLRSARASGAPLNVALDSLCLGRALSHEPESAAANLSEAVRLFRLSGSQYYLTLGLLALAAQRRGTSDYGNARKALDEARALADRCELKLQVIDCCLEEVRLILAVGTQEQERARLILENATSLIANVGYGRRLPDVDQLTAELRSRLS